MTKHIFPSKLAAIASTDKIDSYDVYLLRREFLGDQTISREEANHLFALDMATSEKCPDWGHFFSEAIVDYLVYQTEPLNIVSEDNAHWLVGQISEEGLVNSKEQMEVLVKVLETAKSAPVSLAKYALDQVSHAVLNNQGPVAEGRNGSTCVICKNDVEVIRRLMYGFASEGGQAVTKDEAEFLFDLNDQTIENENDPAWNELFMRAVGNYLLFTSDNEIPERRVALQEDTWLEKSDSLFGSLAGKLKSVQREMKSNAVKLEENYGRNNEAFQASAITAAAVTLDESEWVAQRIGADGVMHENEKALLRFLKQESPKMHPSLKKLVDQAA